MNIKDLLTYVPERAYYGLAALVVVSFLWGGYGFFNDARLFDHKIALKQLELGRVIALKDKYLLYTGAARKDSARKTGEAPLSLGLMEDLISKNFVSGTLNALKPVTLKEKKGKAESVVEVKVTGTALGEVISFVNAVESSGLVFKKFQLTLPQDQELIDLFATITER